MRQLKRTIAALMLAIVMATGVAHAQADAPNSTVTGSWWWCQNSVYVPFYGWVVFHEWWQYNDGIWDPSYSSSFQTIQCTLVMVCIGDNACAGN